MLQCQWARPILDADAIIITTTITVSRSVQNRIVLNRSSGEIQPTTTWRHTSFTNCLDPPPHSQQHDWIGLYLFKDNLIGCLRCRVKIEVCLTSSTSNATETQCSLYHVTHLKVVESTGNTSESSNICHFVLMNTINKE